MSDMEDAALEAFEGMIPVDTSSGLERPKLLTKTRASGQKSKGRSAVSNGRDVLPDVDGRSVIVRRYRDICNAIFVDQGGEDQCSESRKQLIRRFAAAAMLAEQMEAGLARGAPINIAEHAMLSSTLVRLTQRIGINRVARDVTPTLSEYLANQDAVDADTA